MSDQRRELWGAGGFSRDEVGDSGQGDFMAGRVAAGRGIALLSETICRRLDPNQTATIPLASPIIPWRLALMWRRGGFTSFAARAWIDITREILGPPPPPLSPRYHHRPRPPLTCPPPPPTPSPNSTITVS